MVRATQEAWMTEFDSALVPCQNRVMANPSTTSVRATNRIDQIRDLIEQIISVVGEHPVCELKVTWLQDTPYHRAEVIKDIQSIANSNIQPDGEKYIVIGVDESTRSLKGCRHEDYDDASLRQLLESHLDRVPEFELLKIYASNGTPLVVIRIPHQTYRPFIVKKTITDNKGKPYLQEGDIYHKPGAAETGSTGKQRVTKREELIAMLDVDQLVHAAATERINQLLPIIRLEERSRLGSLGAVPVLTATDDEFASYVEQALVTANPNIFPILLEKLRDKTVGVWEHSIDAQKQLQREDVLGMKAEFVVAIRRLTHFGLLLIKFQAPLDLFCEVVDQLEEVLYCWRPLRRIIHEVIDDSTKPTSLAEHATYSVPAVEALFSAYLLAGYSLGKTKCTKYFSTMYPRFVPRGSAEAADAFLSWPYYWEAGPVTHLDLLVIERFAADPLFVSIVGPEAAISRVVRQADCLLEWHSFLSFVKQHVRPGHLKR